MRRHARPRTNMDLLLLRNRIELEQRLDMFPAAERAHSRKRQLRHTLQTVTRRISKDGTFHVRRLHLATVHLDLAVGANGDLRNVEGVVVVFGEAEGDGDVGAAGAFLNHAHLRAVDGDCVFDVFDVCLKVEEAAPI